MCNFIKADGKQCGLAKNKAYCHIKSHKEKVEEIVVEEIVIEEKEEEIIVEEEEEIVEEKVVEEIAVEEDEFDDCDTDSEDEIDESEEEKNEPSNISEKKMAPQLGAIDTTEPPTDAIVTKPISIGTKKDTTIIENIRPTPTTPFNEFECFKLNKGREYEYWIRKCAIGDGLVSWNLLNNGQYTYDTNGCSIYRVVDSDNKKNTRYVWLYNRVDACAFVKFVHEQMKRECHEIFITGAHIKFFIDCDAKMTDAEFAKYGMTEEDLIKEIANDYIAAFKHTLEYNDNAYDYYSDDIDYMITNRSRKINGGVKLSCHIITNVVMSVPECKAVINYMKAEGMIEVSATEAYIEFIKSAIDVQPYRKNGSLSLPGGVKHGNVQMVLKPFNQMHTTGYLLDRSNCSCRCAFSEDFDTTPQTDLQIFDDATPEFIKNCLKHIKKVPDYYSEVMDVYARIPKNNFLFVGRTGKSFCSICKRDHENDSTLMLIFNERQQAAYWKCTHADKSIKAKRWFGRASKEIDFDEDMEFAENDVEEFAEIAAKRAKAAKEALEAKKKEDKKSPLDILREMMMKITKDRYKREARTGIVYKKIHPYYYQPLYQEPIDFLNAIFAAEPMWHTAVEKTRKELISMIKQVIHPDFEWIKLDYDYIGYRNGCYDLSTGKFTKTDDITINIQVRKYFDEDFVECQATPLLDSCLRYQNFDDATIEFTYFLLGRLMTRITDKFDFMTMLYGTGGSGKSLLANLVKHTLHENDIGVLSSTLEEKFGLVQWTNKQLVSCDDIDNLAKTLNKANFLSMGTRGAVSCPIKNGGVTIVHDWSIPLIINSNRLPNYQDKSGEVIRRIWMIEFERAIEECDKNVDLETQIKKTEMCAFIQRARSTYLRFKQEYGSVGVETIAPQPLKDTRRMLLIELNNTARFISERCTYDDGNVMPLTSLNKSFREYLKNRFSRDNSDRDIIDISTMRKIDSSYTAELVKICKDCRQKHKKGCCDDYSRTNRTSRMEVYNLRLLTDYELARD